MRALLVLTLLLLCSHIGLSRIHAGSLNDEVSALLSIKSGLIDSSNYLKNWELPVEGRKNEFVHCNWTGVFCNSNGEVEKLDLSHKNLTGNISNDIGRLSSLAVFNISHNVFSSSLPKSISNLKLLRQLDVSINCFNGGFPTDLERAVGLTLIIAYSNCFSGSLPGYLGNVTSLETLDLRGSYFEGTIPSSYKNLQKLKFLGLSGNNLTGRIPAMIGQLSSLESIFLGYNAFEGRIPREFGNLVNLQYLDLAAGSFSGHIPAELGRLKKVQTMLLYNNRFEGAIPLEIGTMTSLISLDLSKNRLSGEIPSSISKLKNLKFLNLMSNRLTGQVPTGIGELPKLQVLELWNNSLTGSLPMNLGKSLPLYWLDVSTNSLTGKIPANLCSNGNLSALILFNNAFSGPIPIELSTCPSLFRVRLNNNFISGTIPPGFGKLGKLERLELANNSLTGKIPDDIGLSTSLSFIDLSRNRFQSTISLTILSIPNLDSFLVSNNELKGAVSNQTQDCPSLYLLDLSNNQFSGSIPGSIASCKKLVRLNLQNNQFTGEIPIAISAMPSLAILDLSNNSLTGSIPDYIDSSPSLETLNLSYNHFKGPVPTTSVFVSINPNDLAGNPGLCGGPLSACSSGDARASSSRKKLHIEQDGDSPAWILLVIVLGIMLLVGKWMYKNWVFRTSSLTSKLKEGNTEWPWRLMAFQKVNFSSSDILACIKDSNVIGMGSTGIVYKAEIQRPQVVVAVKKLHASPSDIDATDTDDLIGEVKLLGRLRHRNIVRVLGYLHNNTEAMMVSEYMQNGNLTEALHGEQPLLMDWVSRYNIAVGIAQGLAYLHHDCNPPVIHRDIKSSNILLDANLDARITDFGLARIMAHKNETVSMVAGTYGYIAPEYGYMLKVDEKTDVYSFGVVLLELLTGRKPLDRQFGESYNIVKWIHGRVRLSIALEEALDANAGAQCEQVQEEILLVLRIALLCTAELPKDRPSMRDALIMLEEAKPRRKSSSSSSSNNSSSNLGNNNANKDKKDFASPVTSPNRKSGTVLL